MKTVDGRIIPSSDRLLHDFLKRASWTIHSCDELTLFRRGEPAVAPESANFGTVFDIGTHTQLVSITKSGDAVSNHQLLEIRMNWKFQGERDVFPWMFLRLKPHGQHNTALLTKGLCGPEAGAGAYEEIWRITAWQGLAAGDYSMEAIFVDNSKRAWFDATGRDRAQQSVLLSNPIPLGQIKVRGVRAY
jgi:hypothetical protein